MTIANFEPNQCSFSMEYIRLLPTKITPYRMQMQCIEIFERNMWRTYVCEHIFKLCKEQDYTISFAVMKT